MRTALLISEQRLKSWTNLDSNVRNEEIAPWIIAAQDVQIQTTLGTLFLDRLKAGVIANDLNADEILLLNDYIAPTLAQYALYLLLPSLKYKAVEKGLLSGESEETSNTTLEELQFMRQTTLDLAEFYDARLREFLKDVTAGTYPQYTQPGTDGMNPNKSTPYFSGLVTNINSYAKNIDNWCSTCAENGCSCK